jgi:hypothetical protein
MSGQSFGPVDDNLEYTKWIHIPKNGYYRSNVKSKSPNGKQFGSDAMTRVNSPCLQTSAAFLELFRNNLIDIGKDPWPYGTHSFRRGGCQWLASGMRWDIRRICDWGGWSLDLQSPTILKYIMSWNDEPLERREDYLNPNRMPAVKCYSCGRCCHCG